MDSDLKELARLACPAAEFGLDDYEGIYPPRHIPYGAKATRLAPSPTGFIHLGNLYGALADERAAKQSNGVFILRVEDTDDKREVAGAVEMLIDSLLYFGVVFDEGEISGGGIGEYGPYRQRQRVSLYHAAARRLIENGYAYPCFCSPEDLAQTRAKQQELKQNPGYYGIWATHRDLPSNEAIELIKAGNPFVIRLKSYGDSSKYFSIEDGIRGKLTMPQNTNDIVLLKANGIPTYHFAHVVDDHFMRITHILRGEEWLSTLPVHVQLFEAFEWDHPVFCHTALMMKMDGPTKRKLSKRLDPELSLEFYKDLGYHPLAVKEYLMSLLNSGYEEWRIANPGLPLEEYPFDISNMGSTGALFDLDKLNDVSKNTLATLPAGDLSELLVSWAKRANPDSIKILESSKGYLDKIFAIGREGANPRKDYVYATQIFEFIKFFFDEYFEMEDGLAGNMPKQNALALLMGYLETYDFNDGKDQWFKKVVELGEANGYVAKPKEYKKNPDAYNGHVGDVSAVIRLALTGRKHSPDIWEVSQAMGKDRVVGRINSFIDKYLA
ncbi:MAG: glutamate--tRNA ligase [Eubacteriaceae bacterium]|nr:glutamate--tRNA ligase [Eubacteriaceae bacterium]